MLARPHHLADDVLDDLEGMIRKDIIRDVVLRRINYRTFLFKNEEERREIVMEALKELEPEDDDG